MAEDEEALLRAAREGGPPTLRLYGWNPPAVSLGRFQHESTAVRSDACYRRGIDVVRRITGGRAVLHDRELTYSIAARSGSGIFPDDVLGAYKAIAAALLAGLGNLGIRAEMVARAGRHAHLVDRSSGNPSCFSSPSWYEILVQGKKIIGSAQRRIPGAFLQHGSILIDYDPVLEAEIIPGGGGGSVTCIHQHVNGPVSFDQVKAAVIRGFEEVFEASF